MVLFNFSTRKKYDKITLCHNFTATQFSG
jgi:hypothetical protein